MKNLIFLFAIAGILIYTGCSQMGGGGNSPEAVAKKFITHMTNGEMDKAAKYGTEETKKFLEMAAKMADSFGDMAEEMAKEHQAQGKASFKDFRVAEQKDDMAIVEYTMKAPNGNISTEEVHLRNVGGKWLVDFAEGMDMDVDEMDENWEKMQKGMEGMMDETDEDMKKMGKDAEKSMEEMQKSMEELGMDMDEMMKDAEKALEDLDK
jgi:hypothetical protein